MAPLDPMMLGRLYRRHAPALRLFARQWGESGEDLVQEAFLRLARQTPPPESVLPWLYRVVRNAALAALRTAVRRRHREQRASTPESWFHRAEDQLDAREATRLLAELPLEFREVIVARIWGGLNFEEIAELIGCSLPTAHRRYHGGLAQLRERLDSPCTTIPNNRTN